MDVSRQLDEAVALLDVAHSPPIVALLRGRKAWLEQLVFDSAGAKPEPRPDSETWDRLRRECLRRDRYICQGCASKASIKDVHHIIPCERGGASVLSNLITLCQECHGQIHPWILEGVV